MRTVYEYLAIGALATAAATALAHLVCWNRRLSLTWRYTIGVCCIGAGVIVATRLGAGDPILIFWSQAGASGIVTALLHRWRERRGDMAGEHVALLIAGRLVERAKSDGAR